MGMVGGVPLQPDPSFATLPRKVVVKLKPGREVPGSLEMAAADSMVFGDGFRDLRAQFPDLRVRPYFSGTEDPVPFGEAMTPTGASASKWRSYVAIDCPSGVTPEEVAEEVSRSDAVELAYPESRPAPPPAVMPGDDPLAASQGYLAAAPIGIDARWAWEHAGADGNGVGLVDIEYGWTLDHEDLRTPAIPLKSGVINRYRFHGTAVLGQIVARDNQHGCVGIAPNATTMVVSQERRNNLYNPADAIRHAATVMRRGDVLLLEMQSDHPQVPYVPVEIDQAVFDAIAFATSQGIIVIEPAGNAQAAGGSGTDLSSLRDALGRHVLNPDSSDFRDSGAILVGAAAADQAHRRLKFSNFGKRVNCFAWGERVQTCGDRTNETSTTGYTVDFGGTSAASPIVAGAAVLLQSWRLRAGLSLYTPKQMRELMSGRELNTQSGDPNADRIGVMPNLRAIIEQESAQAPISTPGVTDPISTGAAASVPLPVWLSYLALAVITIANAVLPGLRAAPPPGVDTPKTINVDFASSSAVELAAYDNGAARAAVFVRNDEAVEVSVSLDAVLVDHAGAQLSHSVGKARVASQSIVPIEVRLPLTAEYLGLWDKRLPARGSLRLEAASGSGKVVRFRDLSVPQVQPALAELVITSLALVLALALFVSAWFRTAAMSLPDNAPPWTPRSWSSNLALGGAVLTALLAITSLPSQTHYMARSSYATLSPFFAVLVALAPATYDLLKVHGGSSRQGALKLFAFSAAVTVWATLGQLGTSAVLFLELAATRTISSTAAVAAGAVVAGVGVAVLIHAFRAVASYSTPATTTNLEGAQMTPATVPRPWALL